MSALRIAAKAVAILIAGALVLIAGLGAFFWFYPDRTFRAVEWLLPEAVADRIAIARIHGNPRDGYKISGIAVRLPAARVEIASTTFTFNWDAIRSGRFAVDTLAIHSPHVALRKRSKEPNRVDAPASTAPVSGVPVPINRLTIADGRVDGPPLSAALPGGLHDIQVTASLGTDTVQIDRLAFYAALTTVSARGAIDLEPFHPDVSLTLEGPIAGEVRVGGRPGAMKVKAAIDARLAAVTGLGGFTAGRVHLDAAARGDWPSLDWHLSVKAADLRRADAVVAAATVAADGRGVPPTWADASVHASGIDAGGRKIDRVAVAVKGSTSSHRITIEAESAGQGVALSGRGALGAGEWRATWTRATISAYGRWRAVRPFRLAAAPPVYSIHDFAASDGTGTIKLDGTIAGGAIRNLSASFDGLPLALLNTHGLVKPALGGVASGTVVLAGAFARPVGDVAFSVSGLSYKEISLGEVSARAKLKPDGVTIDRLINSSERGDIVVSGEIPYPEKSDGSALDFRLALRANAYRMSNLLAALGDVKAEDALLNADLKVAREDGIFSADGRLRFTAATLSDADDRLPLRDVDIVLKSAAQRLLVERGVARIGDDGRIRLAGSLDRERPNLRLTVDEAPLRYPRGLEAELNGGLALEGSWDRPVLAGTIRIPRADYTPPEKEKRAPDEEPDEAAEPAAPPAAAPDGGAAVSASPLAINIDVALGRDAWFKQQQTSVQLTGGVTVRKEPFEPVRLFGTISTRRGTYVFYGRDFEMESGSINFSGQTPPNPTVNIRAVHLSEQNRMRIFLNITGRLRDLDISLSSQPPLEESDILSVLLTGRPLYELGGDQGDADAAAAARNVVAGYLSERVRQQLQEVVDLDMFRLQLEEGAVSDFLVGKAIGQDLFVSYGQSLGAEGEQRIRATYHLTPRLALEGYSTTAGRYVIDLLFNFGFK